jgi:polygalacturonase
LATSTVTPRPTNFVLVTDYGAKGDGSTTDNTSIQNAVNAAVAAGKAVIVNVSAAGGTYLIDSNNGINLPSNTMIYFDSGAKFIEKAGTTNSVPKIINSLNASNINIIAPVIVGDRNYHTTPAGEYGMGLYIRSCTNVYIENPNISNCWGDAVYLGDGGGAQTWCENVTIKNANFNNNRRQGISVISVKGLQILDPIITNTNGTDPQCGIDFEPNTTSQFLQGITVTNPFIQNNAQHGIHVWIGFGPGANPIDITVTNAVNVKNNLKGNYYVGGSNSSTKGYIKIDGTYYLNK